MGTRKLVTFGAAVLIAGVLLGLQFGSVLFEKDIARSLKKVEDAFVLVNQRYVDEVDSEVMAANAIEGMMKELDPHSVYIDAKRMQRENERFDASFEGIGISYDFVEGTDGKDTLSVLSVIPGGPSELVGLLSGDRIIAVDDSTAVGYTDDDVQSNLKGPRGTQVKVTIRRPGYRGTIEKTITRDRIPIVTMDVAFMMDSETGYIKLNRFARTTHAEFREGLIALKNQGMTQLIVDLRSNPGGYMSQAVRISDEFLSAGQVIVSQRGRTQGTNETFTATDGGLWESGPVMLLVDGNSASASEILAGALQDHDRGLIVGRRTFGKGLVQNQFALSDGSALRVTIARYYTPTGRLIQTPYEGGDRADYDRDKRAQSRADVAHSLAEILEEIPDSLKYRTDGGRTVVAGGGILPDYMVPADTLAPFVRAVLARGVDMDFVRTWVDRDGPALRESWEHRRNAFVTDFDLNDAVMSSFFDYAGTHGLHVVSGNPPEDSDGDRYFARDSFSDDMPELRALLKGRLARRLFDNAAWYPVYQPVDPLVRAARRLWGPATDLADTYVTR